MKLGIGKATRSLEGLKPFDPKLISNDQVGSGACAHTKFSSATRCKVSTGQKMSKKSKMRIVFFNFQIFKTFFKLEIWMLMLIFMAKKLI